MTSGPAALGERWWSRRFVDLVEGFTDAERMRRGRAYARRGNVLGLRVAPYEVTARVRGAEEEPYEVVLGIDAIDDAGWAAVEAELASAAVYRARLLAGDMPPEIEVVVGAAGHPLFPMTAEALRFLCECPDWGEPCKHAAAVLYVLAEAFDDDPFLILEWNGRSRAALLTALRRLPATAATDVPGDEPLSAAGFWTAPTGLAALRTQPPAPPVPPGFVLEIAPAPPVKIRRRPLTDVLLPAYHALAAPTEDPF
ncbi:SWIM zinc finger family protein [Actinomadura flavalba]|uniref:SWIM zinc finger family protein n=1 Tax=Actinomadura flavalba TaxID=1120938 RepID=UPI0003690E5C|nr:SWIM zinc finger family protein [Actinomadura flavalba]